MRFVIAFALALMLAPPPAAQAQVPPMLDRLGACLVNSTVMMELYMANQNLMNQQDRNYLQQVANTHQRWIGIVEQQGQTLSWNDQMQFKGDLGNLEANERHKSNTQPLGAVLQQRQSIHSMCESQF